MPRFYIYSDTRDKSAGQQGMGQTGSARQHNIIIS